MSYFRITSVLLAFVFSFAVYAEEKVIRIYHDSDYSAHAASAESMKMGFETALNEIGHKIGEHRIEFVEKDHRGNVVRSRRHFKEFLTDPDALFILGGLHSPPYIKYRKYINENEILLLVPWAAGGPITRYEKGTNWVFRLSVDDTKAGLRISDYAINSKNCKKPHLLLENTGWGKSNFKTITNFFVEKRSLTPKVTWFNWNTKSYQAKALLREIALLDSDCLIFVGNAIEGGEFMRSISELDDFNLPILSHWGITGEEFFDSVGSELLSKLDLHFIQSCFSFVSSEESDFSQEVFKRASQLFPDKLADYSSLKAPTGFVHAYDLGRIVLNAMSEIQLGDDMVKNRRLLRDKLESMDKPVQGLIKKYHKPFSAFSPGEPDAHEALGLSDLCMASFNKLGVIEVKNNLAK